MAKAFYDSFPSVRETYKKANEILGMDIASLSFDGPEEELRKTKNAQVAILLHSVVGDTLLKSMEIKPDIVAGHSLGEYSANVSAGSLELDDALHVVRFRGELMWQSGVKNPGTMSAIVGLDNDQVEGLCREASIHGVVSVANYNSPHQVVISGQPEAVKAASELASSRGARRVIPLKVSGAFHSELMRDPAEKLSKVLSKARISDPRIPVVANWSGKVVKNSEGVSDALKRQMLSPVLWINSIKTMLEFGAECFVEVGPGKVLLGLLKRIDSKVAMYSVADPKGLESTIKALKQENLG